MGDSSILLKTVEFEKKNKVFGIDSNSYNSKGTARFCGG